MTNEFADMQADLRSLHEAIDTEAPLQHIRVATLRTLTRHRFFTEEVLRATGDWEPRMLKEERSRRHAAVIDEFRDHLRELSAGEGGIHAVGKFLREKVPLLPPEISDRAHLPLGQLLKYIVHRLASVCLRDREEEAAEHWERESRSFETDAEQREASRESMEEMSPERLDALRKAMDEIQKERERAEPGDDWVTLDEVVGSDEAFEANRRRILREDGQELQLYAMILERRLALGDAFSGFDLINEQETIPMPVETPDWEPDAERDRLITALETVTGQTFRK